jgi:hypothetical protein
MRTLITIAICLLFGSVSLAQTGDSTTVAKKRVNLDSIEVVQVIIDSASGDTLLFYAFEEVVLKDFITPEQRAEYRRLKYNVKKVMPYAKLAAFRLQMMEDNLLLIKLIHRETGKTTYDILKGYRGSVETFYWGAFAKMYNASLKTEYDPIVDYQLDMIIKAYNLE